MKTPSARSLAGALLLAAIGTLPLCAAPIDELLTGLRAEVEKSLLEAKASKTSTYTTSEIERHMTRLETALSKDSFDEAEQALNQLATAKLTLEAKEKISQLQKEIPKASEERQKAQAAQITATIEKAGKACLAAKTESDLDPILLELGTLKKARYDSSGTTNEVRQRLNNRLEGAIRFVNRWQDSLAQSARGFDTQARTIMRELADPTVGSYYPILTRAEIVSRMGKDIDTTGEDLLKSIKSLDDIPQVTADLNKMVRESRSSGGYENSAILNDLAQISRAHGAFKAGNYGSALMTSSQWEGTSGPRSGEINRIKGMLVLQVLPKFLELPESPQPKAEENASEFLLRVAGEGASQGDWSKVSRALDAYRLVAFGYRQPPAWVVAEIDASQQFLAGQSLEKARRFAPAVLAYQRAVKVTGKYSPQKAATERLAVLEKEHPNEFAEAGKEPQVRELLDLLNSGAIIRAPSLPATPAAY